MSDSIEDCWVSLSPGSSHQTHRVEKHWRRIRSCQEFGLGHDRKDGRNVGEIGIDQRLDNLGFDMEYWPCMRRLLFFCARLMNPNESVPAVPDGESVVVALVITLIHLCSDASLRMQEIGRRGRSYSVM